MIEEQEKISWRSLHTLAPQHEQGKRGDKNQKHRGMKQALRAEPRRKKNEISSQAYCLALYFYSQQQEHSEHPRLHTACTACPMLHMAVHFLHHQNKGRQLDELHRNQPTQFTIPNQSEYI
jgi:hypothetical protein